MSEPRWMGDLDVARHRASEGADIAAAWAWWAISQLPDELRVVAARAWKEGKVPALVAEDLKAATGR